MTPTNPIPPKTAVAAPAEPQLPPEAVAAVDQRRMYRAVARELANQTWGKNIGTETAKAIALWCERHGVDPTEIVVLGGNIYLESSYYLRRLAQMFEDGKIEYAYPDHIHKDDRLEALAADPAVQEEMRVQASNEVARRTFERAKYNLPDEAKAAVVFRVKLRGETLEVVGAKWAGGRGKNEAGRLKDPVGEEFAAETAESRAARRALRYLVDTMPSLRAQIDLMEMEAKALGDRLDRDNERGKKSMLSERSPKALVDPYLDTPRPAPDPTDHRQMAIPGTEDDDDDDGDARE